VKSLTAEQVQDQLKKSGITAYNGTEADWNKCLKVLGPF
jgi:hypothetical protein